MDKRRILLLGGARSGKSSYAQDMANGIGGKVLFVATAEPLDEEMAERIARHRADRPPEWHTIEIPSNIGKGLTGLSERYDVVIIDCLTLLMGNVIGDETSYDKAESAVNGELDSLIKCLESLDSHVIIVSNEVGMGIVPENPLARVYRDMLGKANQILAGHCSEVYFLIAGIPMRLKPA